MPLTVITLKRVPNSLRGDLTRWMQEIATGVYVGNYNSRIRDYLWKRVTDLVGDGEASMVYSFRNEIGYSFHTCNTERQVVDYEGIPLVLIPVKDYHDECFEEETCGFSNASRYHQARRKAGAQVLSYSQIEEDDNGTSEALVVQDRKMKFDLVFLDIETTGLDSNVDQIIEIGAIKVSKGMKTTFHRLVRTDIHIPEAVSGLTGITDDMLKNGSVLENAICEFDTFIRGTVLVGYNISFDIKFLNKALEKVSLGPIHNKIVDLMQEAKKKKQLSS